MTSAELVGELRTCLLEKMPLPGRGKTPERHLRFMEFGRRNLSFARLAEAHFDAVAILVEANRPVKADAIYGVWASETPGKGLALSPSPGGLLVNGEKMFCSGAALVDRALVTVTQPEHRLIDVDMRAAIDTIVIDGSQWKTQAFRETKTATVTFRNTEISEHDVVGDLGWYLERPGFWHGACGPAACWAGGAESLMDFALMQTRNDPHTVAHQGAMQSSIWAMRSFLQSAGEEIDRNPEDRLSGRIRALTVRHLVEQACSDVLRRFARAYGPYPLAMNEESAQQYQELDLYLRQAHAERDLELLGELVRNQPSTGIPVRSIRL
jgi:alkylation response protein AidB-like acyl-CoA dehydrogenase